MLTDKMISVVVTCYRDEGSVRELLRRLETVMQEVTPNWEVIYVNDASPDQAEQVLLEEARTNKRLTVISHSRNFGAQVAFTTGMMQAKGDAVVIMDGDLQDPPDLIHDFVRLWIEKYDVVYGIRAERTEGWARNLGYKVFYRILKRISYLDVPVDAGEFSLMDRVVVDVILHAEERDRLVRGLRVHAGFRQTGVPFKRPARFSGESTQSLLDYVMWAFKSFTSYSLFPLRLITVMSFLLTLVSFLFLLYFLAGYLLGLPAPPGFMSLMMIILTLGAIIMFSLGMIGEYLGRLFLEIKQRPQPVISRLVNDHRDHPLPWLGRVNDFREQSPDQSTASSLLRDGEKRDGHSSE
ncbi:MAG: glycosyltransferase [Magnetococcales bacterium]|nr:glycosyltransferase [Magnetococcales bacterium]